MSNKKINDEPPRVNCWFSCGAASAVATKMTIDGGNSRVVPVYCETGAEHPDNERFIADCENWFGVNVHRIKSSEYNDTWEVWEKRKYLAGIDGAPCTSELKIRPRCRVPDDCIDPRRLALFSGRAFFRDLITTLKARQSGEFRS